MQASLDKPQKVKNILVRHNCPFDIQIGTNYQHPETPYLLKYAPKYYKTLTLKATSKTSLLSKVKKIKKLQKFNGYYEKNLPQQLWFDLWKNTRKQIEEPPKICWTDHNINPSQSFWERFNKQKLKFFPNVKRIWLQRRIASPNPVCDKDSYLSVTGPFMRHIRNLRKLESLKVSVREENLEEVTLLLSKLNGLTRVLKKLDILGLETSMGRVSIRELFENKNFFAHLTNFVLVAPFEPIFAEIPQMCKNLKYIALNTHKGANYDENPGFQNLVASLQELTQLKGLLFNWPNQVKDVWHNLKPQASLEYLCLVVHPGHLNFDGLCEEDKIDKIVKHWEELNEVRNLELNLSIQSPEEFNITRTFVTRILQKTKKLERLRFDAGGVLPEGRTYEPFSLEDVPHIHETLKKFEYRWANYREDEFVKFDFKVLEVFKNLKSVEFDGNILPVDGNVEDMVNLLQREGGGEYPLLKLHLKNSVKSPVNWLRENLEALKRSKRADKNLKVDLKMVFGLNDLMETFEGACNVIQSANTVKNLKIELSFDEEYGPSISALQVKEIWNRYPGMKNVVMRFSSYDDWIGFIRRNGEKEQRWGC